jgi:hypothetical protein
MMVFPPERTAMFEYQTWVVQSGFSMAGAEQSIDDALNQRAAKGWRLVFAVPSGSRGILLIFERERHADHVAS